VRLVIIESNLLQAELLHYFCTRCWGLEVAAVVKTGGDGIAAVARIKPDLVLVTLTPPDLGLADFIGQLQSAAPAARLILLTAECNEYLVHIIGTTDYHALVFSADESLYSLGQVIERVRQGARFVSARIARCQAALWAAPASFPKLLSKREQEVLVCIAHALSDEEIARQLGFATGTALAHRRRLMGKLGIHSTPKLIRYCADKGFNSGPLPRPPQPDRRT
jgi:DNA-binding NarL/FixJ family response regulator